MKRSIARPRVCSAPSDVRMRTHSDSLRRSEGRAITEASQAVALWNPIDLGYSAVQIAYQLATKKVEAKPGATISIGRVGSITLDDTNSAAMAAPFQFDKTNIEEFSKIY